MLIIAHLHVVVRAVQSHPGGQMKVKCLSVLVVCTVARVSGSL